MPRPCIGSMFIYGLKDPRDGKIKYIGKTYNLKKRYYQHCGQPGMMTGSAEICRWVVDLLPLKPEMIVLREIPANDYWLIDSIVDEEERKYIDEYKPVLNKNFTGRKQGRRGIGFRAK